MKKQYFIPLVALFLLPCSSQADSGTWLANPSSNDWNTGANWSSGTVPTDIATLGTSKITDISISAFTGTSIIFTLASDAYTITALPGTTFELFSTDSISNSSGFEQNFVASVNGEGSGNYVFFGGAITGPVTFTQQARTAGAGDPGFVQFQSGAKVGDATFHDLGATVAGGVGGRTDFFDTNTSADQCTIINEGATAAGATGGASSFSFDSPTAANATLIANGGSNGGGGGSITFFDASSGGTARVEIFGNGYLDISIHKGPSFTTGSLEGSGIAYLGTKTLIIGANSLSTTFSGLLQPGTPGGGSGTGALSKIGTGTFTLSGASVYTGGTTVSAGTLVVANTTGSATGTGAVSVTGGTLGGSGIIAGAVTMGTGSGTGAFLAPAHGGRKQLTLTIQGSLTFNSDSTYTYTFKAKGNKSKIDKVIANGITINSGASFNLSGTAQGTLTQGTAFTVMKNTAATPISGTFSNLPDGAIVTVNGNNLQASYEGGDGNDLTLTVVP
jgi:autotransporter-associated beta strand protein